MLKWTVNGPRLSYLPTVDQSGCDILSTDQRTCNPNIIHKIPTEPRQERRKLKRKSSDVYLLHCNSHTDEKENQLTSSTPLHSTLRYANESPLRKLDSLRDLSNIVPEQTLPATPKHLSPMKFTPLGIPETQVRKSPGVPIQYASTLPTFDVEYSPCGLVPGQLLALRGIGIADTYFDKPRYLTQDFRDLYNDTSRANETEKATSQQKPQKCSTLPQHVEEDTSLSSSKMGDMTLERMIDAILESTRKERKLPKVTKQSTTCHPRSMSPTYTPADDPASDLQEFWDTTSKKYLPRDASTIKKVPFNEREVGASLRSSQRKRNNLFQLRRQRAVRRKRRITTKITSSVKSSAQKLLSMGGAATAHASNSYHKLVDKRSVSNSHDDVAVRQGDNAEIGEKNTNTISPDSGHNSSSDIEDSTLEASVCYVGDGAEQKGLDATKRRLSFSNNYLI